MQRDRAQVLETLQRLLANGPVAQAPSREADLQVLLALAGARFAPGRPYTEREVNAVLRPWLAAFCAPGGFDHVTLRRALVDARFLMRNKAGSTYEARMESVGETIADDAKDVDPAVVLERIRQDRDNRKRERTRG